MADTEIVYNEPEFGVLANAFGLAVRPSQSHGFKIKGQLDPGEEGLFGPQLFTPGTMEDIYSYLQTPTAIGDLGQWGRESITPETLAAALSGHQAVGGDLLSSLQEGLQSGWEVDVDPLVRQAIGDYYQSYVPGAAETFSGSTGVSSSAFGESLTTGARTLAENIGAYQYNAQEAAAARKAALTPVAGDISANYLASLPAFGADVAAYDRYLAELDRTSTPGAALYDAFMKFSGLDSGGQTIVEPAEVDDKAMTAGLVSSNLSI
jgi:hypothetical protein